VDLPGIPDNLLLAAAVPGPRRGSWHQRNLPLALQAAREALRDAQYDDRQVDPTRVAIATTPAIGSTPRLAAIQWGPHPAGEIMPWWDEFIPSTPAAYLGQQLGLKGPRCGYSAACASSTVSVMAADRLLRSGACDMVLVGGVETIHPVMAAGFHNMRVLARNDTPAEACRPFDTHRNGFVMGEGGAMLVLERADQAAARGAQVYAELVSTACCNDAHHVTDLNADSEALEYLLAHTLRRGGLAPSDIDYVNAHGTGTHQNDVTETRALRRVFGSSAESLCVSSVKACLGHLVNSAGATELAITALTLRDGCAPPTVNLTEPDPECDLDYIPLVARQRELEHAVKISVAFGGHLAAATLRRWSGANARRATPPGELLGAA
jgi:3-oxoacyl-(acyl-carrier-protein) synthase